MEKHLECNKSTTRRSPCPIACVLDLVGDKWSLLVLRDVLLLGKRFYQEFVRSPEGVSTNILADRLRRLEDAGILTKERDAEDRKRFIYRPTEMGLELLPVLLEVILWGAKYQPPTGVSSGFLERIAKDRDGIIGEVRERFAEPTGV